VNPKPQNSMRIAVTGRQGQVARALSEAGIPLSVEVITLGRPELDLAKLETIEPALRAASPDMVVNAAAYTAVDQAESEPEIAAKINKDGAGVVAAAAKALRAPIIHLSSDYVFDGANASAYAEDDPVAPTSAYGVSQLAGERAVAASN
jgi:dTDP-4-dehydrorhamnose reductase